MTQRLKALICASVPIALIFAVGCSLFTGPESKGGIFVISGDLVKDTIDAEPVAPLVIEVRDSDGRPIPGIDVTIPADDGTQPWFFKLGNYCSGFCPAWRSWVLTLRTDTAGRASLPVKFGDRAGTAPIRLEVDSLQYATTTSFTILPGRATHVQFLPSDTLVRVGGTVPLRAVVADRGNNDAGGTVTVTTSSAAATYASAGTVSGVSVGRVTFTGVSGAYQGTGAVTVVPSGTIAVREYVQGRYMATPPYFALDSLYITVLDLDGSNVKRLGTAATGSMRNLETSPTVAPRWNSSGDKVFYNEGAVEYVPCCTRQGQIASVTTTGVAQPVFASGTFAMASFPDASRDGNWLYVSGFRTAGEKLAIWRARADGSALSALVGANPTVDEVAPAVSPDGTRIAYEYGGYGARLAVRDIATGVRTALEIPDGFGARWSPAGDLIAYLASNPSRLTGTLRVVRPDGTQNRSVTSGFFRMGFDWSPDGRYIIAREYNPEGFPRFGLVLIDVASGARYPLRYSGDYASPAWRPTP